MRGIFYDVYFSLSFTDHSQQGVVGENDVSTLVVIRRRYSPQEVPWRGIHNAIAEAMSMIFSTNLLVYELHVLLLFVLHLVVDFQKK